MSHADPEVGRGIKPALGAYFIIPLLACGLTLYFLFSTWNLIWEARSTGTFIGVILLLLCFAQFVRLGLKVARGKPRLDLEIWLKTPSYNRQRLALLVLHCGLYCSAALDRYDRRIVPGYHRHDSPDGRS